MKKIIFIGIAIVILSTSCTTSQRLTSDVASTEVNDMLKIKSFSFISFIEKGNKSVYNDSISNVAQILLNESLEKYRNKLPLSSTEIMLKDSLEKQRIEEEIKFMIFAAERNKNIKNIPITPLIDSLLTKNGKRFGLVIVQSGFTRDGGNYGNQIAKGIIIGILTLGMYYTVPVKANSTIYALIIDNERKNIAFYNKSALADTEPVSQETQMKQIDEIFENYFWNKQ